MPGFWKKSKNSQSSDQLPVADPNASVDSYFKEKDLPIAKVHRKVTSSAPTSPRLNNVPNRDNAENQDPNVNAGENSKKRKVDHDMDVEASLAHVSEEFDLEGTVSKARFV
jgi:hypothetical protein